ncbi:hypothetical protein PIB30_107704, partial [Stylosanthes scabra]|nr:hypothetical protein [Stylosanthes scabra]
MVARVVENGEQGSASVRSRGEGYERYSGAQFSQQMKTHGGDERWKARWFSMAPIGLMAEAGGAVEKRETERVSGATEVLLQAQIWRATVQRLGGG